jgi:cell division GTPase FtsZ
VGQRYSIDLGSGDGHSKVKKIHTLITIYLLTNVKKCDIISVSRGQEVKEYGVLAR